MDKKRALSLGETIATLMIIGVIAVMTMPILNTRVNQQRHSTMLAKLYSAFGSNIQSALHDDSVSKSNDYNDFNTCSSISCLRVYGKSSGKHNGVFANPKFISIDFICNYCFKEGSIMPDDVMTAGDSGAGKATNISAYRLHNGAAIALYDYEGNCETKKGTLENVCGVVVFDTNAEQAPNSPGADRFAYYIVDEPVDSSYLVPFGYSENDLDNKSPYNKNGTIKTYVSTNDCIPGTITGYNCTAKVMTDNWKVTYR